MTFRKNRRRVFRQSEAADYDRSADKPGAHAADGADEEQGAQHVPQRPLLGGRPVLADVDLDLTPGRIAGLVGESGSGKSMTALAIIGLLPEGAVARGRIDLDGQNLLDEEYVQVAYNSPLQGTAFQTTAQPDGTFYNQALDTQGISAFLGQPLRGDAAKRLNDMMDGIESEALRRAVERLGTAVMQKKKPRGGTI